MTSEGLSAAKDLLKAFQRSVKGFVKTFKNLLISFQRTPSLRGKGLKAIFRLEVA